VHVILVFVNVLTEQDDEPTYTYASAVEPVWPNQLPLIVMVVPPEVEIVVLVFPPLKVIDEMVGA
jgi:hypothetical protein